MNNLLKEKGIYFKYLDSLMANGTLNAFVAVRELLKKFPELNEKSAWNTTVWWLLTYTVRNE